MKNLVQLILAFLFVNAQMLTEAAAQPTVTLVISPNNSNVVCPQNLMTYTVSAGSNSLPTCTYTWTISGGTIHNGNTGTSVDVKWNDESGTGTLTVTTSACSSLAEDGNAKTVKYTRQSVFGQNFASSSCSSSVNVPYCSTAPVTLCVAKMYIKNTGGVGEPPSKEVDAYLWTIPAGWKQTSTPNVGPVTISTTASTIQIEPIGSGGASVYAVGSVKNSCGQGVSDSNPTTITLVRTPALTVSPTAGGSYTAKCGLTAQVSFTVTAPPCATTYSWNIPSGWSGSSTSSSIVVTPNGLNGGTLSVAIGLSTGSSVTVSRDIPYSNEVPPALSLSKNSPHSELCVGDSFVYTATLPPGYPANFGFDWYASSGILINGLSSSTSAPVHTSTNSVTVTAAGQAYGTKFIHARLNNTVCSPGFYGTKETRVGVFSNSEFSITGPSSVCPNTAADFTSSLIGGSVTGYQWTAPNGWSYSGQGTPYFHVSVPYSFSGGEAITLRLMNRCGITNTPYVRQLYSGYCGYSFSPNPVSNILTVSDLNLKSDETAQAVLLDKSNRGVKTGKSREGKIELDVSDLPTGQYVLLVRYKGRTETQNIIVEK